MALKTESLVAYKEFKIPWYKRILMWIFMRKAERMASYERAADINEARRLEAELTLELGVMPPTREAIPPPGGGGTAAMNPPKNPVPPSINPLLPKMLRKVREIKVGGKTIQVQKLSGNSIGIQAGGDIRMGPDIREQLPLEMRQRMQEVREEAELRRSLDESAERNKASFDAIRERQLAIRDDLIMKQGEARAHLAAAKNNLDSIDETHKNSGKIQKMRQQIKEQKEELIKLRMMIDDIKTAGPIKQETASIPSWPRPITLPDWSDYYPKLPDEAQQRTNEILLEELNRICDSLVEDKAEKKEKPKPPKLRMIR